MSKCYRLLVSVSVSNLSNRVYFRYLFDTDIHRFLPSFTCVVLVPTVTKPYHTSYI
ncbi:hypothetical protein Hanom_Chr05g00412301 [Helianthus anomalus]